MTQKQKHLAVSPETHHKIKTRAVILGFSSIDAYMRSLIGDSPDGNSNQQAINE